MAKKPAKAIITIIATYLYPPPLPRDHDWKAFYEEDEFDDSRHVYGRTAPDAINNLTTKFPRED